MNQKLQDKKTVVYLGTGTSYNVTGYPGWKDYTSDNFIVGMSSISTETRSWGGTHRGQNETRIQGGTLTLAYNNGTGILSISKPAIRGAVLQFGSVCETSQDAKINTFAFLCY